MYAIIDINGKQYQVEPDRYLDMDLVAKAEGDTVTFDRVVMVVDGEQSVIGQPFIEGMSLEAKVLKHWRGAKVLVYKMRCKKGYRRKNGHRQHYSRVQFASFGPAGASGAKKSLAKAKKPAAAPEVAEESA